MKILSIFCLFFSIAAVADPVQTTPPTAPTPSSTQPAPPLQPATPIKIDADFCRTHTC